MADAAASSLLLYVSLFPLYHMYSSEVPKRFISGCALFFALAFPSCLVSEVVFSSRTLVAFMLRACLALYSLSISPSPQDWCKLLLLSCSGDVAGVVSAHSIQYHVVDTALVFFRGYCNRSS